MSGASNGLGNDIFPKIASLDACNCGESLMKPTDVSKSDSHGNIMFSHCG